MRRFVRKIARRMGVDIATYPRRQDSAYLDQARLVQRTSPKIIFDIGANTGQSAERYQEVLPGAQLFCFEPLPEAATVLRKKYSERSSVRVFETAIGDRIGSETLHTNPDWAATSSLLERPQGGGHYYPWGAVLETEVQVAITTLENVSNEIGIDHVTILKMDVQGSEMKVLRGAANLLANCAIDIVYTEVVFVPAYDGQPLVHDLAHLLDEYGYSWFGLYNLAYTTEGQLRCGDAIFVSPLIRSELDSLRHN